MDASSIRRSKFPQTSTFGASERHVAYLGTETVVFVIAPGQSGHLLSPIIVIWFRNGARARCSPWLSTRRPS